ncbi:rab9 effector protein [Anaeramoeba flamelloides]|uniref:Rab9 effector protein n=1 Tax=Anaeramoeba flamelloides TaxID=1746091 RepID=A0ABQ8XU50_9EUKA|nr:rab9 effector protein [Anaeramoeba flamelloides]
MSSECKSQLHNPQFFSLNATLEKREIVTKGWITIKKQQDLPSKTESVLSNTENIQDLQKIQFDSILTIQRIFRGHKAKQSLYSAPLKENDILKQKDLNEIFSNVESIYQLNLNLYGKLLKRKSNLTTQKWADIFSHFVPFLKLYSGFISNYDTALSSIKKNLKKNQKFSRFLKRTHKLEKLKALKLTDFLITPVQRLPRYVMLIQGIVECMDINHKERKEFELVLSKIRCVADHVNQIKNISDNFRKLVSIQIKLSNSDELLDVTSGRRLIHEDHLQQQNCMEPSKSWGLLFNDLFVSAIKTAEGKFEAKIVLSMDSLHIASFKSISKTDNTFVLFSRKEKYYFVADDKLHREQWLERINGVFEENEKQRKALLKKNYWKKIIPIGETPPPIYWSQGCISDGYFYIFGGKTNKEHSNLKDFLFYRLNLENWEWEVITPESGDLPPYRFGHTLSAIKNSLFLFGGTNGKKRFGDLHIYLIDENKWENEPQVFGIQPTNRSGHSSSAIGDLIWIFGGRAENGDYLDDLHCLDTKTNSWYNLQIEGMNPSPRAWHTANFIDEQLIIYGGGCYSKTFDDVWVYELRSNKWYEADVKGRQPPPRYAHSSVVIDNCIYIMGGVYAFEVEIGTTILNLETATWEYVNEKGDMPLIQSHQVASLFNQETSEILLFSGKNKSKYSNDLYILNTTGVKKIQSSTKKNLEINDTIPQEETEQDQLHVQLHLHEQEHERVQEIMEVQVIEQEERQEKTKDFQLNAEQKNESSNEIINTKPPPLPNRDKVSWNRRRKLSFSSLKRSQGIYNTKRNHSNIDILAGIDVKYINDQNFKYNTKNNEKKNINLQKLTNSKNHDSKDRMIKRSHTQPVTKRKIESIMKLSRPNKPLPTLPNRLLLFLPNKPLPELPNRLLLFLPNKPLPALPNKPLSISSNKSLPNLKFHNKSNKKIIIKNNNLKKDSFNLEKNNSLKITNDSKKKSLTVLQPPKKPLPKIINNNKQNKTKNKTKQIIILQKKLTPVFKPLPQPPTYKRYNTSPNLGSIMQKKSLRYNLNNIQRIQSLQSISPLRDKNDILNKKISLKNSQKNPNQK